jgi:hypothetical protein
VVPDNGISPLTVDMSGCQNCVLKGNKILGNILSYPAYDLAITGNEQDFTTLYATPTPAISLRAYDNAMLQENRVLASFVAGTPTILLNANSAAASIAVKGNSFTVPTDAANYGVQVVNSDAPATGRFIYSDNTPLNQEAGSAWELVLGYGGAGAYKYISYPVGPMKGITSVLSGALAAVGDCNVDNAVTVAGAQVGQFASASATSASGPGDKVQVQAFVSAANTATVKVCATAPTTPTATTYRVQVSKTTTP